MTCVPVERLVRSRVVPAGTAMLLSTIVAQDFLEGGGGGGECACCCRRGALVEEMVRERWGGGWKGGREWGSQCRSGNEVKK
jgi:hypothetical protein